MEFKNYYELLSASRSLYKSLKKCHFPFLKQDIIFNSKGFHHLLYDGLGKARNNKERIRRLKLLPLVIFVIENAQYVYSYKKIKNIEYWVLKDRINNSNRKIIVILRKIGSGEIQFYSVWDEI
ncbi:MAG: hypothetical protein Q7R72_01755 [bacterium]|nr:hypothetical protein [bacterium]